MFPEEDSTNCNCENDGYRLPNDKHEAKVRPFESEYNRYGTEHIKKYSKR